MGPTKDGGFLGCIFDHVFLAIRARCLHMRGRILDYHGDSRYMVHLDGLGNQGTLLVAHWGHSSSGLVQRRCCEVG